MSKCRVVSFSMEKGGCCKTTGVMNTGIALAENGYKVALVDTDPQSHLTTSFGLLAESLNVTITDLITNYIQGKDIPKELILSSIIPLDKVDLIPSNYYLMNHDYALKATIGGEFALLDIIKPIKEDYDFILIDCPSSTNIFTLNALIASNSVVIPIQPHFLSVNGLQMILHTISSIKRKYNENLVVDGVLVSMAQKRTNGFKDVMNSLKNEYSDYIELFNTIIPQSVAVSDAPKRGMSVIDYVKSNPASIAYNEFAKELLKKWMY
jgi:chromosome partitioning protein